MRTKAALTPGRVAVPAGHICGKAALVDKDDGPAIRLITLHLLVEDTPSAVVRLGVTQGFFCVSRPDGAMPEKLRSGKRQTERRVHADTHRDAGAHLRPKRTYQSCACAGPIDPAQAA